MPDWSTSVHAELKAVSIGLGHALAVGLESVTLLTDNPKVVRILNGARTPKEATTSQLLKECQTAASRFAVEPKYEFAQMGSSPESNRAETIARDAMKTIKEVPIPPPGEVDASESISSDSSVCVSGKLLAGGFCWCSNGPGGCGGRLVLSNGRQHDYMSDSTIGSRCVNLDARVHGVSDGMRIARAQYGLVELTIYTDSLHLHHLLTRAIEPTTAAVQNEFDAYADLESEFDAVSHVLVHRTPTPPKVAPEEIASRRKYLWTANC